MLQSVIRQIFKLARRKSQPLPVQGTGAVVALQYRLSAIIDALRANAPELALDQAMHARAEHPLDSRFCYYAGLADYLLGNAETATELLAEGLELDVQNFDCHVLLGAIRQEQRAPGEALVHYAKAAAIRPTDSAVHGYIGNMLFQLGRHADAIASYERALLLDPGNCAVHSNLLLAMNSLPNVDRDELFEAHRRWARRHEHPRAAGAQLEVSDPDPERPLRIGYVSADFREHSVAYFIEPVWSRIDRARYATYVYDNFSGQPDSTSRRLQSHADVWRRVAARSDEELLQVIREDRIDILVDLSGHTGGNRLPLFGRRAAPVQATWFAYMNTTGLAAMDYRITDDWHSPPGEERYYTETLIRIPCCACFAPAPESPEVNSLPAATNGFITFASFNSWTKISSQVISTWARILASTPGSRLLAVVQGGEDPPVRKGIQDAFAARGIEVARLDIRATRPIAEFLRMFHEVDIALDPFPYSGGTTTLHTLWMGVPIVTLQSEGETGRSTAGFLRDAGLADLISSSVEGYYDTAVRLAGEPDRLQRIRASLRETMMDSPVMQATATTRALETAFREMWRVRAAGDRSTVKLRQQAD